VGSFTPRPLYPKERTLGIHWIGDCVGPRAGLDAVLKIPSPYRDSLQEKTDKHRVIGSGFKLSLGVLGD